MHIPYSNITGNDLNALADLGYFMLFDGDKEAVYIEKAVILV